MGQHDFGQSKEIPPKNNGRFYQNGVAPGFVLMDVFKEATKEFVFSVKAKRKKEMVRHGIKRENHKNSGSVSFSPFAPTTEPSLHVSMSCLGEGVSILVQINVGAK